jgi:hypothetical protein
MSKAFAAIPVPSRCLFEMIYKKLVCYASETIGNLKKA